MNVLPKNAPLQKFSVSFSAWKNVLSSLTDWSRDYQNGNPMMPYNLTYVAEEIETSFKLI